MAYRDFEVLPRRTATDKELRNKACNITKNLKYDGYQRNFAPMIYTCLLHIKKQELNLRTNNLLKNYSDHLLEN